MSKKKVLIHCMVDEAEAMCRFFEAQSGIPRPKGVSAAEALGMLVDPDNGMALPSDDLRAIRAGVRGVMTYMVECLQSAGENVEMKEELPVSQQSQARH